MEVFIIHSSKDLPSVEKKVAYLKQQIFNLNSLILKNTNFLWKVEALKKIKKAQAIVFFVGESSHKSPYIAWEIKKAKQYHKPIYTLFLDSDYQFHPELLQKNEFSEVEERYDQEVSEDSLCAMLKAYENEDYSIFNQDIEKIDTKILFEQYRIFLQTSETLVARRQTINSFYITVNSAFVALFSALMGVAIDAMFKMILVAILSFVGIVLATSWIKILESYGRLNASKMTIIRNIEKQLPASLYDAEWKVLSDKLNKKRYVSFTNSEKRLPIVFISIYISIFIIFSIMMIITAL